VLWHPAALLEPRAASYAASMRSPGSPSPSPSFSFQPETHGTPRALLGDAPVLSADVDGTEIAVPALVRMVAGVAVDDGGTAPQPRRTTATQSDGLQRHVADGRGL
jgi:hypothetical protein